MNNEMEQRMLDFVGMLQDDLGTFNPGTTEYKNQVDTMTKVITAYVNLEKAKMDDDRTRDELEFKKSQFKVETETKNREIELKNEQFAKEMAIKDAELEFKKNTFEADNSLRKSEIELKENELEYKIDALDKDIAFKNQELDWKITQFNAEQDIKNREQEVDLVWRKREMTYRCIDTVAQLALKILGIWADESMIKMSLVSELTEPITASKTYSKLPFGKHH